MVCLSQRNKLTSLGIVIVTISCSTAAAVPPHAESTPLPARPMWKWKESDNAVALLGGEQVIWQFNYAAHQNKAYFHPVAIVGGPTLTWDQPPDHVWHHGMWFSWKFINKVNYWEIDRKTGKPAGRTQWSNVAVETRPDSSARIAFELAYVNPAGDTVMTGKRVVEISAPDDDGTYTFDWTCTFTAGDNDVELDRTVFSNEPGGKPWGGYAGLSIRLAEGMKDRRAITTREPVSFQSNRYRGKATAIDYSGAIGQDTAGIAICDHPLNLNHPTPWYVIAGQPMTFVNAAVICFKPHTLPGRESFTLRYRVLVHSGRWDARRLAQEYSEFVKVSNPAELP